MESLVKNADWQTDFILVVNFQVRASWPRFRPRIATMVKDIEALIVMKRLGRYANADLIQMPQQIKWILIYAICSGTL
jgi:hypothetical protein